MVTTRSGRDFAFAEAIELSKLTAVKDVATREEKLLAPIIRKKYRVQKSRSAKVSQTAKLKASQVSKGAQKQPKTFSAASLMRKRRSPAKITPETNVSFKSLSKTREAESTTTLVVEKLKTVQQSLKQTVTQSTEHKLDTARTLKVVIKIGGNKSDAFDLPVSGLRKAYPRGFFSNAIQWKVGHQPFMGWKGVDKKVYQQTFDAFKSFYDKANQGDEGLTLNITQDAITPGHAYAGDGHKFHALVEPILSCATNNSNQKMASANLFRVLMYRNGSVSKISPNYHKLSEMTEGDIAATIRQGGRHEQNAKYFKALFRDIKAENIKIRDLSPDDADKIHKEAMDADDWTDGLLSLDFMKGMEMQEIFDKLVTYEGIACKTAACIMCFTFGFAVFAVDTHVFRQCAWLRWIPEGCNRNDAFKFLTLVIPPELHRDLHQAFWHHGQRCFRCNEDTWHKTAHPRWKEAICPLEQFGINRFPKWEKKQQGIKKDADTLHTGRKKGDKKKSDDAEKMVTVWLKTEKDVADAKAAGYDVMETEIDDAFGAAPELSNVKKDLKKILHITETARVAFKEFQKTTTPKKPVKVQTKITSTTTTRKRKVTVMKDAEVTTTISKV